jgi:hypothetical protein
VVFVGCLGPAEEATRGVEAGLCLVRNAAGSHQAFPVVNELQGQDAIDVIVCVTAQHHRKTLDQVLKLVNIVPGIDRDLVEKSIA